ncbi:unnamed protein product [Notodromas monacha]|uniref:Peptidase S1 domain-containing protein n=1 Tax=Notodromas monacha TaxID=399045 RepID=A0A7R9GEE7_9CRUS|nr:unnamed protein product [Notodromas monacha]CAG0917783.1 unnamed protein product [Notodromas monacha]
MPHQAHLVTIQWMEALRRNSEKKKFVRGGDAGPDHVQHLMMVSSSYYILAAVVVGVAAVAYTWWRLVGRAAIHRRAHRIMSDMLSDAGVVTGRDVVVHDTGAFVEWMRNGSLGIGETYMRRDWDTREMSLDEVLFRLLMLPRETKRRLFKSWSTRWVALATRVLNMQSESRAKMVADAHYNLGNEFFKLWLDANMQYSCAYWKGVETLDEAQVNKMRLLARKLKLEERKDAGLGSSSSSSSSQPLEVLDLGCGWGTLACYLAENYNVRVTGVNISVEQGPSLDSYQPQERMATSEIISSWIRSLYNFLNPGARILGGTDVMKKSQANYMVAIVYRPVKVLRKWFGIPICSGSLLSRYYVLTAASCFSFIENADINVMAHTLKPFWKTPGRDNVDVLNKTFYPGYDFKANPVKDDLAVVGIEDRLPYFNQNLNAIALPTTCCAGGTEGCCTNSATADFRNQVLKSVGYGLQQNVTLSGLVFQNMICLTPNPGTGNCPFDYGGPILNTKNEIVGVLTLLVSCTESDKISLGNELSGDHLSWVKSTANQPPSNGLDLCKGQVLDREGKLLAELVCLAKIPYMGAGARILGGTDVEKQYQANYMVAIVYRPVSILRKWIGIPVCSGSLLSRYYVLTAASCFSQIKNADINVMAYTLKPFWKTPGREILEITNKTFYPGYDIDASAVKDDLAVIGIEDLLPTFNDDLNAISLPTTCCYGGTEGCCTNSATADFRDQELKSVGYGLQQNVSYTELDFYGGLALVKPVINQRLRTLSQKVNLTDAECGVKISNLTGTDFGASAATIFGTMICLTPNPGTGNCPADFGGPILNSKNQIVGVLTVLVSCTESDRVNVANELTGNHLSWVKSTAKLTNVIASTLKPFWKTPGRDILEIVNKTFYPGYDFKANPVKDDLAILAINDRRMPNFDNNLNATHLPTFCCAGGTEGCCTNSATANFRNQVLKSVGYGLQQNITFAGLGNIIYIYFSTDFNGALALFEPLSQQRLRTIDQKVDLTDAECGAKISNITGTDFGASAATNPDLPHSKPRDRKLSNFNGALALFEPLSQQRLRTIDQKVDLTDAECGAKISNITGTDFGASAATNPDLPHSKPRDRKLSRPILNTKNQIVGVLTILVSCTESDKISLGNELTGEHLSWVKATANLT